MKFWVKHNKCEPAPVIKYEEDKYPEDGTRVRREEYSGGEDGAEVVLVAVENGGHTWASGWQY